ncbi:hypothetical protein L226DRAFT_247932 [Lentinus tigrinus ALCF2SS1-7]|uniref:Uncharacterized protein n=1 Tax=Lentinus tigrinus ALCF2SS1-6 TaxID=1328759 RepID=A0A5C2SNL6_9APHY|nr:hypothetical protein L227DRAFT_205807 [Lentinus tigrinus ALCF2SS1-6]RPD79364.1 hypothetical protein L226DRAFT_247932 [Lentinus tigrinus ALCF2SS1-7]
MSSSSSSKGAPVIRASRAPAWPTLPQPIHTITKIATLLPLQHPKCSTSTLRTQSHRVVQYVAARKARRSTALSPRFCEPTSAVRSVACAHTVLSTRISSVLFSPFFGPRRSDIALRPPARLPASAHSYSTPAAVVPPHEPTEPPNLQPLSSFLTFADMYT